MKSFQIDVKSADDGGDDVHFRNDRYTFYEMISLLAYVVVIISQEANVPVEQVLTLFNQYANEELSQLVKPETTDGV